MEVFGRPFSRVCRIGAVSNRPPVPGGMSHGTWISCKTESCPGQREWSQLYLAIFGLGCLGWEYVQGSSVAVGRTDWDCDTGQ